MNTVLGCHDKGQVIIIITNIIIIIIIFIVLNKTRLLLVLCCYIFENIFVLKCLPFNRIF